MQQAVHKVNITLP